MANNDQPGDPTGATTLRGAPAGVDAKRVGMVAGVLALVALGAATVIFTVAGIHQNAQINALRNDGVLRVVTVTSCVGNLGGSGSNPVGYTCRGTWVADGQRFTEELPGDQLYASGARVEFVGAASDPGLVETASYVKSQRSSWRVFLVPIVLAVVLAGLLGALWSRRRKSTARRVQDAGGV